MHFSTLAVLAAIAAPAWAAKYNPPFGVSQSGNQGQFQLQIYKSHNASYNGLTLQSSATGSTFLSPTESQIYGTQWTFNSATGNILTVYNGDPFSLSFTSGGKQVPSSQAIPNNGYTYAGLLAGANTGPAFHFDKKSDLNVVQLKGTGTFAVCGNVTGYAAPTLFHRPGGVKKVKGCADVKLRAIWVNIG